MANQKAAPEKTAQPQQSNNPQIMAEAYFQTGRDLFDRSQFSEAASCYQQAGHLYGELGEDLLRIRALNQLGICLVLSGQAREALEPLNEALDWLNSSPETALEAAVQGNLGLAFSALKDHRSAFKAHKAALESAEKRGDEQLQLNALINLADNSNQDKKYTAAQGFALVALDLAKKLSPTPAIMVIYDLLGMISARQGDLKAALEYHELAYQEAQGQGDLLRQGIALANQGLALEGLTELDRAAAQMSRAAKIFETIGSDYLAKTQLDLKRIHAGMKG